jgi:outer membrane protein
MRKLIVLAACALLTAVLAGNAAATDLQGRMAITGRVGVINPANSERNVPGVGTLVVSSDAGFIGGGGFLFGVDNNVAAELDITRASFHTGFGRAELTNLAIGAQYRLPERQRLIPYAGAGMDILVNDLVHNTDTVLGVHLAAGLDYMLQRQIALNAEIKGVEAFTADVRDNNGDKFGKFDPSNVTFTVGARFFFN